MVGIIWWMWHIPLYIADGKTIPWMLYLLQTVALSLIFTWFFLCTKESTFFAIFLHNMSNYPIYLSHQFFPQVQGAAIARIVFFVIMLLLSMGASISMASSSKPKLATP
jgi:hypothetical protein